MGELVELPFNYVEEDGHAALEMASDYLRLTHVPLDGGLIRGLTTEDYRAARRNVRQIKDWIKTHGPE